MRSLSALYVGRLSPARENFTVAAEKSVTQSFAIKLIY